MESNNYVFTALRGYQAGREYYLIMCPLKIVPKLFAFQLDVLPASLRAQRTLNKARIPEIASYITHNKDDYIFSSLTVSVDAKVTFESHKFQDSNYNNDDIGKLSIPIGSNFLINDGQHRRAAIEQALHNCPDIGNETISVVLFVDVGLKKSQQMFADLNKHAVRPTRSIGILYDHRDPLSNLMRELIKEVDTFKNLTEIEKTSISNRSTKLFTLSSLYQSTTMLLKKSKKNSSLSDEEKRTVFIFWNTICAEMRDWKLASQKKISTYELRRDFIHSHALFLYVVGKIGSEIVESKDFSVFKNLNDIDWSRSNTGLWEGRAMHNGRISNSHNSIILTSNLVKQRIGLQLTSEELSIEKKYLSEL